MTDNRTAVLGAAGLAGAYLLTRHAGATTAAPTDEQSSGGQPDEPTTDQSSRSDDGSVDTIEEPPEKDTTDSTSSSSTSTDSTTDTSPAPDDYDPAYTEDTLSSAEEGTVTVTSLTATPDEVQLGDPVELEATIEGPEGRVNVPVPFNVDGGLIDDIPKSVSFTAPAGGTTQTIDATVVPLVAETVTVTVQDETVEFEVTG